MKMLLLFACLLLFGCEKKDTEDAQIRKRIEEFQEAFNQQDANRLASLWDAKGIYINPVTGEVAEGRDQIAALYRKKFAEGKIKHLEAIVKNVTFPEPSKAIEEGVTRIEMKDEPARQAAYKATFVKNAGEWFLQSVDEIELTAVPSNYDHLKEVAWLTGNWEYRDRNVTITFDGKWDRYKNFLIRHFKMRILGTNDIDGKQIIGWDAKEGKLRSWVFDSDGGFGEGTWRKEGNSWYATLTFTLNDGRAASSTDIYTPIDDHTYTFASVGRELDGEVLPNLNPVHVIRQEAP